MTNEQKLTKLLQIAVENGWQNPIDEKYLRRIEVNTSNLILEVFYKYDNLIEYLSINDLILNWEESQISFINAIEEGFYKYHTEHSDAVLMVEYPYKSFSQQFRTQWVNLPTSQRLEYLFTTFKHLL